MAGAEGLGAALGNGVALRQLGQLLVSIADLHGSLGKPCAHGVHEIPLDGFLNNNHNGLKARLVCVIDGIVQNCFPLAAHGIDLLQTAITAAHTGGHDNENRFFRHNRNLLGYFCVLIAL